MNSITISGLVSVPKLSHTSNDEKFYSFKTTVKRLSETVDVLPCVISENLVQAIKDNARLELSGEIRTRNILGEDGKHHCELYVFVNSTKEYGDYDKNEVYINGKTCRPIMYRETPLGRVISDVMVASNRKNGFASDYIPCIAWGRNAQSVMNVEVGTKINLVGRLQSRTYRKVLDNGMEEVRVTYEVSTSGFSREDEE